MARAEPAFSQPQPAATMPRKPRQTGRHSVNAGQPAPLGTPVAATRHNAFKRKNAAPKHSAIDDSPFENANVPAKTGLDDPFDEEKTGVGVGVPLDLPGHRPVRGYLADTPATTSPQNSVAIDPVMLEMVTGSLQPKHKIFVERYLVHRNGSEAVREAGFNAKYPADRALKILKIPKIAKIIAALNTNVAKKLEYTAESAMLEAEQGMAFARETENATAFVKAVELRAKLRGLLIEKLQHQMVGAFTVNIGGITREPQMPPPGMQMPKFIDDGKKK